jgi:hypothetical protein
MGRTLPTTNDYFNELLTELKPYRDVLTKSDQQTFDLIFSFAHKRIPSISNAASPFPFEMVLLSVMIELMNEIERLKEQVNPPQFIIEKDLIPLPSKPND